MPKRPEINWPAIRAEYEKGQTSVRDLARRHGCSESGIRKRARAERWRLAGAESAQCAPPIEPRADRPTEPNAYARDIAVRLLDELSAVTAHPDAIEQAIIAETAGDATPSRRRAMLHATSLGQRAQALRTIVQTLSQMTPADEGKKAAKRQAAKRAATGKFATRQPPRLVVDNGNGRGER